MKEEKPKFVSRIGLETGLYTSTSDGRSTAPKKTVGRDGAGAGEDSDLVRAVFVTDAHLPIGADVTYNPQGTTWTGAIPSLRPTALSPAAPLAILQTIMHKRMSRAQTLSTLVVPRTPTDQTWVIPWHPLYRTGPTVISRRHGDGMDAEGDEDDDSLPQAN